MRGLISGQMTPPRKVPWAHAHAHARGTRQRHKGSRNVRPSCTASRGILAMTCRPWRNILCYDNPSLRGGDGRDYAAIQVEGALHSAESNTKPQSEPGGGLRHLSCSLFPIAMQQHHAAFILLMHTSRVQTVYSRDLIWEPMGEQAELFARIRPDQCTTTFSQPSCDPASRRPPRHPGRHPPPLHRRPRLRFRSPPSSSQPPSSPAPSISNCCR